MARYFLLVFSVILVSCAEFGELEFINDLPASLNEVSGIETSTKSDLIWMLNDSGNAPELYGLDPRGTTVKVLKIEAKNKDWEDLTADPSGNLYIGDLGNILADDTGAATGSLLARTPLTGDLGISGLAVVIHEGEDDLGRGGDDGSRAVGNAGGRPACGTIMEMP